MFPLMMVNLSLMKGQDSSTGRGIINTSSKGLNNHFYGLKMGMSVATQSWSGFEVSPLISVHAGATMEFVSNWRDRTGSGRFKKNSLVIQLGYHRKGSAFRNVFETRTGTVISTPMNEFHNICLTGYGKRIFRINKMSQAYFGYGLQISGTVAEKIEGFSRINGVQRFNAGLFLGGGYEFKLNKAPITYYVELSFNPDITDQFLVAPGSYTDPQSGLNMETPEQRVKNLNIDLSVGIKFVG